jgi:hypothetical protein
MAEVHQTRNELGVNNGAPARELSLVTKSDSDQAIPLLALRVYVADADAPASLKIRSVDTYVDVTLTFPAGVFWEPIGVSRVWSTGSTANAVVHGVPARNAV